VNLCCPGQIPKGGIPESADRFTFILCGTIDGFVKSPSAALRFTFVVVAYLVSTPHSSGFARLASGAFYFAIVLRPFYEIINIGFSILSLPIRPSAPHFIRPWML
jgi:hypothetical protein